MRIPMMFRWPGKLPVREDELLFSAPDIYPTLLGLMGMSEHIPDQIEGTDFSNTVAGRREINVLPRSCILLCLMADNLMVSAGCAQTVIR